MFYFDRTFLILIPGIILVLWAGIRVKTTFNKYAREHSSRGISGAGAARRILDGNGLHHVRIEAVRGKLTDHFDPRDNVIRLSEEVYGSTSVAAIGVACHEAGHAVQYAEKYAPIKIREAIVPAANIGSTFGIILVIAGVLLTYISETFVVVAYVGIALFSLVAVFQLVTLPTEFNASRRALAAINKHEILTREETVGAKKVLSAAALTYVAALAYSLLQILRFLLIVRGTGGRRR